MNALFKERPPALSFKIAKAYFDNNLSDQVDLFTLNADGDYYERTIAASDLTLEFSSDTDCELFQFLLDKSRFKCCKEIIKILNSVIRKQ